MSGHIELVNVLVCIKFSHLNCVIAFTSNDRIRYSSAFLYKKKNPSESEKFFYVFSFTAHCCDTSQMHKQHRHLAKPHGYHISNHQ